MSELVHESKRNVPPLIIALTTEDEDDALSMVEQTRSLGGDVGYKIPRWFDQSMALRGACKETGMYTVLDAQLDDGIDEMAINTRRLLKLRRGSELLLPNAITMSPAKETVRGRWREVNERIIDFARTGLDEPVTIISHIDQTRMRANDPLLHETELRSIDERNSLKFDAYELHVDTVLSGLFPKLNKDRLSRLIILASRVGLHNLDETPDDIIFNRIARTYRRGVTALYAGNSIMRRASSERIDYIKRVLDIHEEAKNMPETEFQKVYPRPISNPLELVDIN